MQLSPHFTLAEFTRSDTADRLKIANTPTKAHQANLQRLAAHLEKVRSLLGDRPITVNSAYRNPAVNRAVGGVKTSDHAQGHAADIVVHGLSAYEVAKRIRDSGIKFDQLILETSRKVVHISFAPRMRQQVLTQEGGAGSPVQQGLWL